MYKFSMYFDSDSNSKYIDFSKHQTFKAHYTQDMHAEVIYISRMNEIFVERRS